MGMQEAIIEINGLLFIQRGFFLTLMNKLVLHVSAAHLFVPTYKHIHMSRKLAPLHFAGRICIHFITVSVNSSFLQYVPCSLPRP